MEPDPKRARISAFTIGGSYVAGGAIPLAPYLLAIPVTSALAVSVGVTLAALAVFGGVKGRLTGRPPVTGGPPHRPGRRSRFGGGVRAGAADFGLRRSLNG